jgi:hypothetical protein
VLHPLPSRIASFADFRDAYPLGRVLSRETGYLRPYGKNPYRGYDRIGDQPFLFHDPVDRRLPPMERVLGVSRNGQVRIYPLGAIAGIPVVNDTVGGDPVVIFSRGGVLSVLDAEQIRASREIATAAAYERRLDGRVLDFEHRDGRVVDRQMGSEWNLFGRAVSGKLKGSQLKAADNGIHFAFAWLAFNPASEVYTPGGK